MASTCSSSTAATAILGRVRAIQDYLRVTAAAALYLCVFVGVQWRIGGPGDPTPLSAS